MGIGEDLKSLELEIYSLKKQAAELRRQLEPEKIENYRLKQLDGSEVSLKELFGNKKELLLVHNMGPQCPYCTLWADGFSSLNAYLQDRAVFALESDVSPAELKAFTEKREWKFPVVSSAGSTLKKDLGFQFDGSNEPGVSSLFLENGEVFRHSKAVLGPGDNYCSLWGLFDLLKNGSNGWEAKYQQ